MGFFQVIMKLLSGKHTETAKIALYRLHCIFDPVPDNYE